MLLQHPWLASVSKPNTIAEADEDAESAEELPSESSGENSYDKEVGDWVTHAIERKKAGLMGSSAKPALHAAPLDSISPSEKPSVGL
jgi:mitogen-activated protein kinase kinase